MWFGSGPGATCENRPVTGTIGFGLPIDAERRKTALVSRQTSIGVDGDCLCRRSDRLAFSSQADRPVKRRLTAHWVSNSWIGRLS